MIVFEIIVLYQISSIITESYLLKPLREQIYSKSVFFGSLISCFLCTSIWVGFILSFFLYDYAKDLGVNLYVSWFFNSMFFSGLAWFLKLLEERLE